MGGDEKIKLHVHNIELVKYIMLDEKASAFSPIDDDSVYLRLRGFAFMWEGGKLSTHRYEGHMPLPWILSSVKWPPSTPPLQSFLFGGNFPFSHLIDFFCLSLN